MGLGLGLGLELWLGLGLGVGVRVRVRVGANERLQHIQARRRRCSRLLHPLHRLPPLLLLLPLRSPHGGRGRGGGEPHGARGGLRGGREIVEIGELGREIGELERDRGRGGRPVVLPGQGQG